MATVSDQEIKNDDAIYYIFQKDSGVGWEEIQVETLARFGEETSEFQANNVP